MEVVGESGLVWRGVPCTALLHIEVPTPWRLCGWKGQAVMERLAGSRASKHSPPGGSSRPPRPAEPWGAAPSEGGSPACGAVTAAGPCSSGCWGYLCSVAVAAPAFVAGREGQPPAPPSAPGALLQGLSSTAATSPEPWGLPHRRSPHCASSVPPRATGHPHYREGCSGV